MSPVIFKSNFSQSTWLDSGITNIKYLDVSLIDALQILLDCLWLHSRRDALASGLCSSLQLSPRCCNSDKGDKFLKIKPNLKVIQSIVKSEGLTEEKRLFWVRPVLSRSLTNGWLPTCLPFEKTSKGVNFSKEPTSSLLRWRNDYFILFLHFFMLFGYGSKKLTFFDLCRQLLVVQE